MMSQKPTVGSIAVLCIGFPYRINSRSKKCRNTIPCGGVLANPFLYIPISTNKARTRRHDDKQRQQQRQQQPICQSVCHLAPRLDYGGRSPRRSLVLLARGVRSIVLDASECFGSFVFFQSNHHKQQRQHRQFNPNAASANSSPATTRTAAAKQPQ